MIVTRTGENTVDITAENEDDQLIVNKINNMTNVYEAETDSLRKEVRILAEDNNYLKFMLDKSGVIYDKGAVD